MSNKYLTDSFKQKKKRQQLSPSLKIKDERSGEPSTCKKFMEDMKLLKAFDMNLHYGPCIGISRLERWNRASKHELEPSDRIRDLIEQHSSDKNYTECLWTDYTI